MVSIELAQPRHQQSQLQKRNSKELFKVRQHFLSIFFCVGILVYLVITVILFKLQQQALQPQTGEQRQQQEKERELRRDQKKQKILSSAVGGYAVDHAVVVEEGNNSRTTATTTVTTETEFVPYFANNGYAKAFDTMQYPMGFFDVTANLTYVAYQGPHEDPYICTYNHTSRQWNGPYHAGVSLLGHDIGDPQQMHDGRVMAIGGAEEKRKFLADNHGKPAIIMDHRGYIHMSFGAHGGEKSFKDELGPNQWGDYSRGRQFHLRSTRPRDISSWSTMNHSSHATTLDWNGCYAQLIQSPNGTLYHFVRHGSHVSCWTYQRSTDYGQTWHASIPIVLTKVQTQIKAKDSWYCRFRNGIGSKDFMIMATCTYHRHNMPPNHNLESFNIYYMELDTRTERWYNVKGNEITPELPLAKEHADEVVQVLDTENNPRFPYHYVHPGSVAMDYDGRPHVLAKIATHGEPTGPNVGHGHRQMFYIRWTGTKWTDPVAVTGEEESYDSPHIENDEDGDFTVDPATGIVRVIFSMKNHTGFSRISQWESTDLGSTFHPMPDLFRSSSYGRLRVSALFHNGHPDALIAVFADKKDEPYRKLFLFGYNGPVPRPRQDAEICKEVKISLYGTSDASTCVTATERSGGKMLPSSPQQALPSS